MKTRRLPILLLMLVLILYATSTIHATGSPDPSNHADTIKPPSFNLGNEPVEPRDRPDGVSSVSDRLPSASAAQSSSNSWQVETVDSEGACSSPSLALDGAGHSHISYCGYPNGDLKYAWYDGMSWQIETVDSEGDVGYPSLALDGADRPHISYYDGSNRDLKHAWHDGMNWHIEIVDSEGNVGAYSSLALDETGHPHISYFDDESNYNLKYARYEGVNWHIETVDSGRFVGYGSSLALDGAGLPHISYQDWGNYGLKYAWYDGMSWQIETVDSAKFGGQYTSLALDKDGLPHITYIGDEYVEGYIICDLKYAWYDGINWHIEVVDGTGFGPSLALDKDGLPRISYVSGDSLKYAWYDSANWHIETVDSGRFARYATSLALDGAGYPHISYYDWYHDDLKHAWQPFWLEKQVTSSDSLNDIDALTHTLTYSLTLSGLGESFFLQDPLPGTVHYVSGSITSTLTPPAVYSPTCNAVIWKGMLPTSTVQSVYFQVMLEITSTRFLSAPLSIVNTAWLTDTESSESATAMSTFTALPPPLSLDKQAAIDASRLYNHDLLTYTLTLTGSDLNVCLWDPLPETVRYVPDSLTSTLVPPAVYSPTARAIIWEGTLPTATVEVVHFQVTANVDDEGPSPVSLVNTAWLTATESGRSTLATASVDVMIPPSTIDWSIETVDSEGDVGSYNSLALDEAGYPHISYYDYANRDLKYVRYDGASWHIETVDSEGMVGQYTSLALDGAGHPHISYSDLDSDDPKYARYDGASWHIETVDSEGWVDYDTSLALDRSDQPHISYRGDGLKYAWHNGTIWQIEIVDSEGCFCFDPSLALDEAGQPHISYYDGYPNHDLKYAWHDGIWHIETVDSEGFWDGYTSLALDGIRHPHISYFDRSNDDLKYAWHNGTNWHIETVDSEGRVGEYTSLALDGLDRPHISYLGNGALMYAWHNGSDWRIEMVDSEGYVGWGTSLALDGLDRPHISYYDWTNEDLKYARWLPLSLDKQVALSDSLNDVDALTHTLTYSLTLFGPGLSVRFQDPLPDRVHYVSGSISSTLTPPAVYSPTLNAVIWEGTLPTDTIQAIRFQVTPEITSTRFLSAPISIVNAAWMDDLEHDRRVLDTASVTITPPPLVLRKQASPSDGLRNDDTLTYTLTISGPGLSVRLWDPLPPLVYYVSGSITNTIDSLSGTLKLPAAVYSPTAHAVVWEGRLPTDTVEMIRFQVTPGISGTEPLSLSQPIVNTAWLTATESGRIVSATVIVNGYYRYWPVVLRQLP